jgi:hypothetical protein
MGVRAVINPMPVLFLDKDVHKLKPVEEEEAEPTVSFPDGIETSEYCCGIVKLGHAVMDDADGGYDEDAEAIFPRFKKAFKEAVKAELDNCRLKGLCLYTLIDNQVVEAEGLKELGFLVMAEFRNPNSGNRVTLYGKLLNQPRDKPVRKK